MQFVKLYYEMKEWTIWPIWKKTTEYRYVSVSVDIVEVALNKSM